MEVFLANANSQMVTVVPETVKPDLTKIKAFIKMTTRIPHGVNVIEGAEKFSLTLRNSNSADTVEE
jgi:translation initiation factor 2 alpha subunit (eIF-2alpha)